MNNKQISKDAPIAILLSSREVSDVLSACQHTGAIGPSCYRDRFFELRNKVLEQALNRLTTIRDAQEAA